MPNFHLRYRFLGKGILADGMKGKHDSSMQKGFSRSSNRSTKVQTRTELKSVQKYFREQVIAAGKETIVPHTIQYGEG